jgi:predicted small secreted protein
MQMKRTSLSSTVVALTALILSGCGMMVVQGSGDVKTETRQVSGFNRVALHGMGEVILTQGESESLEIEADDNIIPYIATYVTGDTLHIGFRSDMAMSVWPTRPIKFYLTMKDVSGLTVSGSGGIQADQISSSDLALRVSGSGDMRIGQLKTGYLDNIISGSGDIVIDDLQTDLVDTTISGSGECYLNGQAETQKLRVSGSGGYQAFDLESQTLQVGVSGSGSVNVWVTDALDAQVVGSGDVNYYGSPAVTMNVSGSGDVSGLGTRE